MAYDQKFFLDLAAKGKDAWNKWRRDPANKDVRVNFRGIDFSQARRDEIDFSGFEFRDHADFSECKWRGGELQEIEEHEAFVPGRAWFAGAALGHETKFTGANFGDQAQFHLRDIPSWRRLHQRGLRLCGQLPRRGFWSSGQLRRRELRYRAKFTGTTLADEANFTSAIFGDKASLDGATFGRGANFAGARFRSGANFAGAAFGEQASFVGATFGDGAYFDKTFFKGRVEFNGMPSPNETGKFGRTGDTGPGRAPPTCLGSPSKLCGFSPASPGSSSCSSIGRLPVMAGAL
jgi:uncharacterized protein YjbI with pentapeptide repeats